MHTGTSLLQEVVYLVSQGADPDEIGLMNIDEQLPVLEYPQPGLEIIQVNSLSLSYTTITKAAIFSVTMAYIYPQNLFVQLLYQFVSQELTSPRLIKSHLPYRFLPSAMHNGEGKVSCNIWNAS